MNSPIMPLQPTTITSSSSGFQNHFHKKISKGTTSEVSLLVAPLPNAASRRSTHEKKIMIAILFIAPMSFLMFMLLATTSDSLKASRVFIVLGLITLLLNLWIFYAGMMVAVFDSTFSSTIILFGIAIYIGWTVLILKKHKKSRSIK